MEIIKDGMMWEKHGYKALNLPVFKVVGSLTPKSESSWAMVGLKTGDNLPRTICD